MKKTVKTGLALTLALALVLSLGFSAFASYEDLLKDYYGSSDYGSSDYGSSDYGSSDYGSWGSDTWGADTWGNDTSSNDTSSNDIWGSGTWGSDTSSNNTSSTDTSGYDAWGYKTETDSAGNKVITADDGSKAVVGADGSIYGVNQNGTGVYTDDGKGNTYVGDTTGGLYTADDGSVAAVGADGSIYGVNQNGTGVYFNDGNGNSYSASADGSYNYSNDYGYGVSGNIYDDIYYANRNYYNRNRTYYSSSYRVNSVNLSTRSVTMSAWSSRSISANVYDSRADYYVEWRSSDYDIVGISGNGTYVTLQSKDRSGSAVITVTVRDRYDNTTRSDTCTVYVEANKSSTFNPSGILQIGSTSAGTTIYDSLRNQYRNVYGSYPSDNATITFGTNSNNSLASRKQSNGQVVAAGINYTLGQYKTMYTEAYAAGTFTTTYTLKERGMSLTGTITFEIVPANVNVMIALSSFAGYTFSQPAAAGTGADAINSAISGALRSSNTSWNYLVFSPSSTEAGTLYLNSSKAGLNGSSVYASSLGSLYFEPAAAGTYSASFQAYNSNGGKVLNGILYIAVPNAPVPAAPAAPAASGVRAQMTSQKLTVNGRAVQTEVYNINDSNYFKLRDVAMMLNGTGSQFSVGYDSQTNSVTATTGQAYMAVGGELTTGADKSSTCVPSSMSFYVNGVLVQPAAYNLGDNNFLKLRDLGNLLNFNVDFDAATNTIVITSL